MIYADFGDAFRELVVLSGVGADSPVSPRIHDLRHSFAVQTLVRWYQAGEDVGALLPRLSTYLGHLAPGYTYCDCRPPPSCSSWPPPGWKRPRG